MESKQLLDRWKALKDGDGLRRAAALVRWLWIIEIGLFIAVACGVCFRVNPVAIAIGAALMGWVTAEKNALRTRIAQWPVVSEYIDWKRVYADLADTTQENSD
jgi:hypothetical protein